MPTDPLVQAIAYGFEGVLALLAFLLTLTYVTFMRMNKDVRRARMFIMADRIHRFLGAFTAGFIALAISLAASISGAPIPSAVSAVVVFFFLGTIAYGIVEIYFIVRPRAQKMGGSRSPSPTVPRRAVSASASSESLEGGDDAPR